MQRSFGVCDVWIAANSVHLQKVRGEIRHGADSRVLRVPDEHSEDRLDLTDEWDAREYEKTVYRVWNDGADYHDGE